MTNEERRKWGRRSDLKRYLLNDGVPVEEISGRALNIAVGLPADAVWVESNFAKEGVMKRLLDYAREVFEEIGCLGTGALFLLASLFVGALLFL